MRITEVRIKLMDDSDDRLQAFCSITFDDCFVVRDLKIIEGASGPFVAMPSRKLTAHCPQCGCKNHLRASYCNQCGSRLKEDVTMRDHEGRAKLYADIAHPINSECRELIQSRVISEFYAECERAKEPGYVSRYDDYFDAGEDPDSYEPPPAFAPPAGTQRRADQPHERAGDKPHAAPGAAPQAPSAPRPSPPPAQQHASHAPTGPHQKPKEQTAQTPRQPQQAPPKKTGDEFGAGIFD